MDNLFEELRRRNVFRVAAAYAVVGWLILQISDIAFPRLGLPDWTITLVLVLLLVGLPVALVLAWAFELTPEGVKKTEEVSESVAAHTGRKLNYLIIGALVLALGYFIWERQMGAPPLAEGQAVAREASIAVLPFADLSPEGDQEYFADGISEEILNVLARIPDLKVAGRTSSFSFKGRDQDLRLIGDQLDVAHVLEGSVRKSGNRLRITTQLISADDGYHLWSQTYDRELTDVFAIQDQVANAVADALRVELGESTGTLIGAGTDSPEAYSLFLRARQFFHLRYEENLIAARDLVEAALVLDPEFADAHALLGRVLSMWPKYAERQFDTDAVMTRALAEVDAAIRIDPQNATAWSAKGSVLQDYLGDQIDSERALLRSAELEPGNSEVANFIGDFYRQTHDHGLAIKWEERAVELDPLHTVNRRDLAIAYLGAGRFEAAAESARRALELGDPFEAYFVLGEALIAGGKLAEARGFLEALPAGTTDMEYIRLRLEGRLALAEDDMVEFRRVVTALENMAPDYLRAALMLSDLYAQAGDGANAARWLRKSLDSGDLAAFYSLSVTLPEDWPRHPNLDAIFADPSFQRLFEVRRRNRAIAAGQAQ